MYHFQEAITNTKGDALIGFYVQAVDPASGTVVDIFADASSTPIVSVSGRDNAAKVDGDGMADFYAPSGTYHLDIYATDGTTRVKRILNHPMAEAGQGPAGPPGPPGSVDASALEAYVTQAADYVDQAGTILEDIAAAPASGLTLNATTRSLLAALSTTKPAILLEAGRQGIFAFTTADLSAKVAADTAQGIYVAPSSDTTGASGAWIRQFEGPVNPQWWGWTLGTSTATANNAAWTAMVACLASRAYVEASTYQAVEHIRFPKGYAEVSATMDLNFGQTIVEGQSSGAAGANGTIIVGLGCTVFRVQRTNTSGAGGAATGASPRADGTIIRNLTIYGNYSGTEAEYHGIHLRARATVEHVYVSTVAGDGIFWDATAGGNPEGNVNAAIVRDCRFYNCRDGISTHGADGNACFITNIDIASCRRWGINEQSFLGNSYNNLDIDACGIVVGSTPTQVSYSGNRYGVIYGQDAGASTNAPSGTTADNTWWYYIGVGAANTGVNVPNWNSGDTYRAGGGICHKSINGRSTFTNCYFEGGQSLCQIDAPALVQGGILAETRNVGTAACVFATGGGVWSQNSFGKRKNELTTGQTIQYNVGDKTNDLLALNVLHPVYAPLGWRWELGVSAFKPNDYCLSYGGGNMPLKFTGPATTEAFGRTVIQPEYVNLQRMAVGSSPANARIMDYAASVPTSGNFARGEVLWNLSPSSSTAISWSCTTGGWIAASAWTSSHAYAVGTLVTNDTGKSYLCTTAGTSASSGGPTGTGSSITDGTAVWAYSAGYAFTANYVNARADPSTGIGYVTGAGGAVTQITSRTTGVTLNKVCGQITLVSAAGSASWQSFTVTNSAVAATDVIRVVQASGTDLYQIMVTAVGAGSFKISFATTGGTTTEAPVFNFAVIKAVAA